MPIIGSIGAAAASGFGQRQGGLTFIVASGGTEADNGNYRIHTFTSGGTFTVSALASDSTYDTIEYIIGAGGGGAQQGQYQGDFVGGGGAGGLRTGSATATVTAYPISIGAGSSASTGGNTSAFGLTSTGGGRGSGQDLPIVTGKQ